MYTLYISLHLSLDCNIQQTILSRHICPWWRHQMETFSALLAICAGNLPVPVNSPHKGQWRGAMMFSLIYPWINDWVSNREAGALRRHRGHYDVIVMHWLYSLWLFFPVSVVLYATDGMTIYKAWWSSHRPCIEDRQFWRRMLWQFWISFLFDLYKIMTPVSI